MSNGRVKLEITVEQITPKTAKEMLEFNTHNRRINDRLVKIYAEAMRLNEWRLNGETIIFDKNGRLQSGQHRLLACIEANSAFWSVVVRGTEPASLYTLDTGRKRSLADALTLRGETSASILGTAAIYRWRYEHGMMQGAPTPPSVPTMLAYIDEHPSLRDSIPFGYHIRGVLGVSAGMYTAFYDIFSTLDRDNADLYTELLCTGEGLDKTSPIYIARRWVLNSQLMQRGQRPSVPMYAAIIVKGWNAWREHREMGPRSTFSWRAEEDFPEAV
jgi:hypothetical protein